MIAAAKSANRVVQIGLQRRSNPLLPRRPSTKSAKAPLAASSTQDPRTSTIAPQSATEKKPRRPLRSTTTSGKAPSRSKPYRDNVIPYNWHLFWHWGNAEVGNNGVHTIDICRWALDVDYPTKVTASGSKLRYDDDQQTPDTCTIIADFAGRTLVWEGVSWSPPYKPLSGINIELRGDAGASSSKTAAIDSSTQNANLSTRTKKAVTAGPIT